ncbi:copper homeostasis protein CutC [Kribbella jejuensis]|uniref:Copper homeostasis protein cutC homolog n=1 Tax=Kribbella jejuensis TaxID=236068 RepID=A0A542ER18_9ACTN|nr:copper homeostasis protein CutC [Kribbella jejuensis]TQJ17812.1 copper homeostasis protein [Kribbella jejuensis]
MGSLLEIIALHPADAEAAQEGGADRLELCASMEADGLCPSVSTVSAIRRVTDLPLRVMLRLENSFTTNGADLNRLTAMAQSFLAAGADGFVLGFLTPDNQVDVESVGQLVSTFPGTPWTFHRAIDAVLEQPRAWRALRTLPGLDCVLTAGSSIGVGHGLDDLCKLAKDDPGVAGVMMAGGGLQPEHIPWLYQSGVRRFHVGSSVRQDGSWTKAYVNSRFVRSWRNLLDAQDARE